MSDEELKAILDRVLAPHRRPQKYGSMHRLRVYPVGRLGYESSCACGWSSDLRTTKEEAHEDARQHAAGMR